MSTELESILTDAYFSPGDAVSTLGLSYYDPQHSFLSENSGQKDDGISIDRSGTELCNIEYSVADAASVEAAAKAAGLENSMQLTMARMLHIMHSRLAGRLEPMMHGVMEH